MAGPVQTKQALAESQVESFKSGLGPFVVAAETTSMPMAFTNAKDPRNPIIFANDSLLTLFGYDRAELLGQAFDFLVAPEGEADSFEQVEAGFRQQCAGPMEVWCRRKNGRVFVAAIFISPVRDSDGLIVQHFASVVDCTAHHQQKLTLERLMSLQAELIHLARASAVGTMATSLGHELNQPLAAITNYAAGCRLMLAARPLDTETLADDLRHIEESALRAGGIINGLRALTRGGAGKRNLFDLAEAVDECIELVLAGACDGVTIEALGDGVVMIEADRVQIQQVVINLLKNGCEAAAGLSGGRVSVTTGRDHDQAVISVEDSGPVLSPADATHLFEWAYSTKPTGMGVGLSISRTIVEDHGGAIRFEAGEEGRTRFTFSLPAAPMPVSA